MKSIPHSSEAVLVAPADLPVAGILTEVLSRPKEGIAAYSAFCTGTSFAAAQHPVWISSWLKNNIDNDCLFALVRKDGRPAMALALEIVRQGPFKVAQFAGGKHANSNFPVQTTELTYEELLSVTLDIRAARPDIDLISLERLRLEFEDRRNTLLNLRHQISPNPTLAMDLDECRRTKILASARKMKRHRKVERKYQAAGGFRVFRAETPDEVDRLFDHFLGWKQAQFAAWGVPDVFGSNSVRNSFRSLFHASLADPQPTFFLYGLEVAGKLRSVNGYSRTSEGLLCDFIAYSDDELTITGPGEFLTYEVVAEALDAGVRLYDFGLGDDAHKRGWCDLRRDEADVVVGLTARGTVLALFITTRNRVKRFIKRNRFAEGMLRWIRGLRSTTQTG